MTAAVRWLAASLASTVLAIVALAALAVIAGTAFRITVGGSIALYFVVWWTLLFAILPIRIRSQADLGTITEGTEPGAPADPALRQRAIWTSIVSTIVFAVLAALMQLAGL